MYTSYMACITTTVWQSTKHAPSNPGVPSSGDQPDRAQGVAETISQCHRRWAQLASRTHLWPLMNSKPLKTKNAGRGMFCKQQEGVRHTEGGNEQNVFEYELREPTEFWRAGIEAAPVCHTRPKKNPPCRHQGTWRPSVQGVRRTGAGRTP